MVQHSRRSIFALLLLVAVLVLTGCAPRVGSGAETAGAEEGKLRIDLPALVVEYDENGEASLFGTPVSSLGATLGTDLSALSLDAETIGTLTAAGVEHIQLVNAPNAIRIYINNEPLPAFVYDDAAFASLLTTLEMFGTDAGPAAGIAPLLPDLGVGIVLKMPGATLPLELKDLQLPTSEEALAAYDTAKSAEAVVNITIDYAADGSFVLGGLNPFMMGMVPQDALRLGPDTMASFTDRGIQSIKVTTQESGILLAINGETLPFIQWGSRDEFNSLIKLVSDITGNDTLAGTVGQLEAILFLPGGLSAQVTFPAQ